MGQYWLTVNLDKREYINPHELGSGLKLREQLGTHPGTGSALIILLAAMPESRGGGDLRENPDVVGRWTGDRVVLLGDYAKDTDLWEGCKASEVYNKCQEECKEGAYKNITPMVAKVIEDELDGRFEGEGWKDFIYKDGTEAPRGMAPDMILSIKK